jgi:uncharacterized membrane protein YdjX (TVP38/TMEM64 family)
MAQIRFGAGAARGAKTIRKRLGHIAVGAGVLTVGICVWLVTTDAPAYQFVVGLSVDQTFLRQTLSEWGIWAPVIFILLQALQVIVAPIPGEVTGVLGGFLFGEWYGLLYSLVGMTVGSVAAFTIGRWLGARSVRALVGQQIWDRIHVVVEARGAGLCAITYFIPGLPKDMASYLFGMSSMRLWLFALVSTLGRVPGTWVLSTQGAHAAAGHYHYVLLVAAIVTMAALPLYYYRSRMIACILSPSRPSVWAAKSNLVVR